MYTVYTALIRDELVSAESESGSFIWHPIFKKLHGANIVSSNVASVVVVFFLHCGLKMMQDVALCRYVDLNLSMSITEILSPADCLHYVYPQMQQSMRA